MIIYLFLCLSELYLKLFFNIRLLNVITDISEQ